MTQTMCTIIAKNYVAVARTLCQSFLACHPQGKCYVLIIDDFQGFVDSSVEQFEIVLPSELGIPDLAAFCFKYNIVELSTAFKPFLMSHLIREKKLDSLLYLDPDILVLNPLDDLYQSLGLHDVVITPHLDHDYEDDLWPDTGHILRHGTYNLGFIGVSSRDYALSFLSWWQAKLYDKCIMTADGTHYVDQKIINLAPTIFDNVLVERGVGYNAAYWNLHSRHITRRDGRWHCNDGLLYFFHFSGYDPLRPELMTKPQNMNRYQMSDRPEMTSLFGAYRDAILGNGYLDSHRWHYSLGYFDDGKKISDGLRSRFRTERQSMGDCGDPFSCVTLKRYAAQMDFRSSAASLRQKMSIRRFFRNAARRAFGTLDKTTASQRG